MRILLTDPLAYNDVFDAALRARHAGAITYRWPKMPDDGDYDVLLAWRLPEEFGPLPKSLSLVFCFGAGADHLLADSRIPGSVPIARLVDEEQAGQILDYVAHVTFARLMDDMTRHEDQQAGHWRGADAPRRRRGELKVTVLGLGPIGRRVATGLALLGFDVRGWTRAYASCPGIEVVSGFDRLAQAADGADLLVNLLPLTAETTGILSAPLFSKLARGAYVVNLGRGGHLDQDHLLQALASGQVGCAWLDVFEQEPPPSDHVFWRHPRIRITPHIAGIPTPEGGAQSLALCLVALASGAPPPHLVRP